jgi:hypothetical protein
LSAARRWTGVAALGLVAASLGLGVSAPVEAQAPGDPSTAFGGFDLKGRANGLQVTYNVENVFPLPPPLFQLSVPEAVATTGSGPTATGFGSAAYPGNVIGNLPAIVAQSKPGSCTDNPEGPECNLAAMVPPYPLAARADHPAGPPEATQDIGSASSRVAASAAGADAVTTMAATTVPGMVSFGSVTTAGHTGFEGGQVVARSRAEFSDVDLLFGLFHFDSVVTDRSPPATAPPRPPLAPPRPEGHRCSASRRPWGPTGSPSTRSPRPRAGRWPRSAARSPIRSDRSARGSAMPSPR